MMCYLHIRLGQADLAHLNGYLLNDISRITNRARGERMECFHIRLQSRKSGTHYASDTVPVLL